jgi:hypothetical protein
MDADGHRQRVLISGQNGQIIIRVSRRGSAVNFPGFVAVSRQTKITTLSVLCASAVIEQPMQRLSSPYKKERVRSIQSHPLLI